jgi:hypothetical protein
LPDHACAADESGVRGIVPECALHERKGRLSGFVPGCPRPFPVCGPFRFYVLMIGDETGVLRHASPD